MTMRQISLTALAIAAATALGVGAGARADDTFKIGFIYPTLNNPFFVDQQTGSDQAGKDFGAAVTHVSGDNDVKKQVQLVEDFIAKKVDAIILQAVDTQGVVNVIKQANDANIPVFTPGESPAGGKVVTSVVFNEVYTGEAMADYLVKQAKIKPDAKVVMLLGIQGTETARNRQDGFEKTLKAECSGCQIVTKQPADFDRAKGLTAMEAILQAQPSIDVVWAANDEMALGALKAIKEANRQKEITLVGTDGIGDARAAIAAGDMSATYALPPFKQGYMVTETAVKYLKHAKVCGKIEEKGLVITSENVKDAAKLLTAVDTASRYWESCYSQ
ncbi:MAG: sugar ABC transporter substrate-binding protein [Roseiarcus sp.]|jgi:ribose transport system substrate-binding protein